MAQDSAVREISAEYLVAADDVPVGYKKTEVGVIPEDWSVSTVGAEFHVQLGKMLDENKNSGIAKLFLGNRAVKWGSIDVADLGLVKLTRSDIVRYRLEYGDILVCEGGEVGRSAIWRDEIAECYYQKALHRLRPRAEYNTALFVSVLHWLAQKGGLQNFVTQTSIAHLPKEKFEVVPIPVPANQFEQTAIATALSDVDALITALEKLIAKKQSIKIATMQQLLTGKTRLPQFALRADGTPKGFKQSELGEVPEDWDTLSLLDVCGMKSGLSITSSRIKDGAKYPCYGGNGLRGFTDAYTHEGAYALIGRQGALCGNVVLVSGQFFASEHAVVVSPKSETAIHWLFYILGRMSLNQYSESSAQPGLSVSKILELKIIFPCKAEQTAIATILSDMDTEIQTLQQRLHKTRQIKQGMMQELLTGKTRLI